MKNRCEPFLSNSELQINPFKEIGRILIAIPCCFLFGIFFWI